MLSPRLVYQLITFDCETGAAVTGSAIIKKIAAAEISPKRNTHEKRLNIDIYITSFTFCKYSVCLKYVFIRGNLKLNRIFKVPKRTAYLISVIL